MRIYDLSPAVRQAYPAGDQRFENVIPGCPYLTSK